MAAPAPTGNYAFDVHIDTGIAKLANDADATIQNLLQLAWTVLIAAVHGLIVMIEWCYTIDLIDSSAMSGVARGLRQAQSAFTQPWLAAVLSVASVLALYHGLVRRRVAETVGQAVLMLAMMAGGLCVIMNPSGTVGSLARWANEAGLGALGAVAYGSPSHPDRALADSMGVVFSAAVGGPWCYLEFGDVGWCSDPARLDPRLRVSAEAIATHERAQVGCQGAGPFSSCVPSGSRQAEELEQSARELGEARTNGSLFLALPANQAMRNSINESGSLFQVLCGGSETPCRGPTAAEAEFRTQQGTGWRFMGLVFIWVGDLGMLVLIGFIAVHVLGAAIASLLYLLLAPAAVLAPALGDGGRAAFRGWAIRLLGAVTSKLTYSFLLGAVLLMARILTVDLAALGWFTQWLLLSTMWWGAFCQRHRVLELALGRPERAAERRSFTRRVGGALETPRSLLAGAGAIRRRLSRPAPTPADRHSRGEAVRARARSGIEAQVARMLDVEHRDATDRLRGDSEADKGLAAARAQLVRLERERARAVAAGDSRRAARLGHRAGRVQAELDNARQRHDAARLLVAESERSRRAGGGAYTREQVGDRERFLDAQARLPDARMPLAGTPARRDYPALAALAGYGRNEYELLAPQNQRAARAEIDRELALREELTAMGRTTALGSSPELSRRQRRDIAAQFEDTLEQRMRATGRDMPASRAGRAGLDSWSREGRRRSGASTQNASSVMRDAHEVAARRKRQLGRDVTR